MREQSALTQFATDAQTTKERLLRAAANGTFLDEPPEPAPDAPGYRSGSTGKFVGYGVDQHQATRSTDTGRITDIGEPEPVSRSTLTARYGPPDGGTSSDADRGRTVSVTGDPGRDRRESMFSNGVSGVQFDSNAGSYRETDRVEREVAPPDDALAEQDEFLSIERNERAAADAGVLQPEPDGSAVGDLAAGANPFSGDQR